MDEHTAPTASSTTPAVDCRFTQAVASLALSSQEIETLKRAVAEKTCATPDTAPTRARRNPVRRLATLCVAAALAVACAAGIALATGKLPVDPTGLLGHMFGGAPVQEELAEQMGASIGSSVTHDGVTVTLDSVVGDRHSAYCVFTVERDDGRTLPTLMSYDGQPILNCIVRVHVTYPGDDFAFFTESRSFFYDADPSEPSIQMVVRLWEHWTNRPEVAKTLAGSTASIDIQGNFKEAPYWSDTFDGDPTWHFEFVLDYEDTTRALETGQQFSYAGVDATIEEIDVSPLGVYIKLATYDPLGASLTETDDIVAHSQEFRGLPVAFMMRDGSRASLTCVLNNSWSSVRYSPAAPPNPHGGRNFFALTDRVVDLNQVAAISIGDIEIAL